MSSLWGELKRRNVVRVAIAYIIVAWLLLQIADTLVPALRLPEWFNSGIALLLILGFPIAILFAWAFELTPERVNNAHNGSQTRPHYHHSARMCRIVFRLRQVRYDV
jgi:hypothetical protein